jgi:hypothetical protein
MVYVMSTVSGIVTTLHGGMIFVLHVASRFGTGTGVGLVVMPMIVHRVSVLSFHRNVSFDHFPNRQRFAFHREDWSVY